MSAWLAGSLEMAETLGGVAWLAIALRALWLLPDWLAKWRRLLRDEASGRDQRSERPRSGPP